MSIRRRLLVWLLSSVLAGGMLAAGVVFFQARTEVNELFDYQLRQIALTLRDRTYAEALQGRGRAAPSTEFEEALEIAIAVWASDGTLLYDSQPQLPVPSAVQLGFGDITTEQGRWRIFAIQQRGLTIQVAQPQQVRDRLALAAAWRTLLPFLVALPLLGLLIWRLVGRELRFLESTAEAVATRSPESLEPIAASSIPEEIQPLVTALNGLLARLGAALAHERQFIADAAHELRTPLTALRLQLQLAERAQDEIERANAHAMLREGIARAVRLVEQLLALARQDPDVPMEAVTPVDLAELARSVAEAHRPNAATRGLELTVRTDPGAVTMGERSALHAMIENLVDNAIRYTPKGRVGVSVLREESRACIEVEDTGPGIPAPERERVFDRFYRGEGAGYGGTGLGLAIVRRIAERHGGRIELLDARAGHGLRARVCVPLAAPGALSSA